jgi:potassium-transporting ATPase KdpC subunit
MSHSDRAAAKWAHRPAWYTPLREQWRTTILSVLLLTLLSGCVFPLILLVTGGLLFRRQAGGSLIRHDGIIIGSELIGQEFTHPEYFHSRPSAAGSGYDGTASGGTNLAPNNPKLKDGTAGFLGIRQLAEEYRWNNGLDPNAPIPIDAVTRSGSGLDPHISLANALLQAPRVARARGLSEESARRLVLEHLEGREFGFLGNPRVSVLELNLALQRLQGHAPPSPH